MPILDRMTPGAVEGVLAKLLTTHPSAPTGALNDDGHFTSMPRTVPDISNGLATVGKPLDMISSEDHAKAAHVWVKAKLTGAAHTTLKLVDGSSMVMHVIDARPLHGTFVISLVPVGEGDPDDIDPAIEDPLDPPDPLPARPLMASMKKDEVGSVLEVDVEMSQMLGWSVEEIMTRTSYDMVHPDDLNLVISAWVQLLNRPGGSSRWRGRHQCKDGSWLWIECTNQNMLADPDRRYVLSQVVDISEEMAMQEIALRQREQLLHRLAQAVPLGLFQFDRRRHVTYANDRLATLVGITGAETVEEQLASVIEPDRAGISEAVGDVLDTGADHDLEIRLRLPGNSGLRLCSLSLRALTDERGQVNAAIACISDVTESARMRAELHERATFDALTGCHNRSSIMSALEATLSSPRPAGASVAVVFLDLDGFKEVNDRLGHAAGDMVLVEVATRLRRAVRDADIVGRLGGDEFLVVCPQVAGPNEAMKVSRRIAELFDQPITLTTEQITLRASLGVATSDDEFDTADTLVARADAVMYVSKRSGAGQPVMHAE